MPDRTGFLSISNTVDGSFGTDTDNVSKYLDRLYATISDYTQTIRRYISVALLLITAFELVNSSSGTQFSVASFNFHKGSVVLQIVPAVVAYLFAQVVIDSLRLADMGAAFRSLYYRFQDGRAPTSDVCNFIMPPSPLYWNIKQSAPKCVGVYYYRYRLEHLASSWFTVVLVAVILAFETHAYCVLVSAQFTRDILWLMSLCFTLACLIISIMHFNYWFFYRNT